MNCPECGWPKQVERVEGCWREQSELACRREGGPMGWFKTGQRVPDEVLLERIREYVAEHGSVPAFNSVSGIANSFARRGIGWHEALRLAGFDPPARRRERPYVMRKGS